METREALRMIADSQFVRSVFRELRENQLLGDLWGYGWRFTKVWICFLAVGYFLLFLSGGLGLFVILLGLVLALGYTAYWEETEMAAAQHDTAVSRARELPALLESLGMRHCNNDRLPKAIHTASFGCWMFPGNMRTVLIPASTPIHIPNRTVVPSSL